MQALTKLQQIYVKTTAYKLLYIKQMSMKDLVAIKDILKDQETVMKFMITKR